MPGQLASRDGAQVGRERPSWGQVIRVACRAHLLDLRIKVRRRPVFAVALHGLLIVLTFVAGSGVPLKVAFVLLPPVIAVMCAVLLGFSVALLAWAASSRHTLYWADTTTGRAMGLTHTTRGHPHTWMVTNVLAVHTHGVAKPPPEERPGYQVMTHIIADANAKGCELRLTASNLDVATKLYEPLGFIITGKDWQRRPEMRRALGEPKPTFRPSLIPPIT